MSSLQRALGMHEPLALDDATLRRIERAYRRLEPDPLFRRRLRGEVMNRYVAEREGYLQRPRPHREMGKLGRAVLYASLGLAISVSAAGAAADRALPGDVLYAVKLQLEEVRMRIAPPSVRDDLAGMVLAERVEEVERLAAAGAWSLVPAAAARVTEAEEALRALDPEAGATGAAGALEALTAVLAAAPPAAQAGLSDAIATAEHLARPTRQPDRDPATGGKPDGPPAGRPAGVPTQGPDGDDRGRGPQDGASNTGNGNDGGRGNGQGRGTDDNPGDDRGNAAHGDELDPAPQP